MVGNAWPYMVTFGINLTLLYMGIILPMNGIICDTFIICRIAPNSKALPSQSSVLFESGFLPQIGHPGPTPLPSPFVTQEESRNSEPLLFADA